MALLRRWKQLHGDFCFYRDLKSIIQKFHGTDQTLNILTITVSFRSWQCWN